MLPKSLSATAVSVAQQCMARFEAEFLDRARAEANDAALIGTAVHGALEMYVKACYIDKNQNPSLKLLLDLFQMSYMQTIGMDFETQDYADGVEMLERWFERTDFSYFTVISAEVKETFDLKTSAGSIPFNFIWDRHDQLDDGEVRVVDYKTNRWGYRPDDLKKLIQVRVYGLVAQIKYPEARRIWVELDMLRHDGPVGIGLTKEDNAATWRFLKREAERIIATERGKAKETLNPNCNFCVRKTHCDELLKNKSAGGIFAFNTAGEAADTRAALEYQKKAIGAAIDEIDRFVLAESKETDLFEFEGDSHILTIGARNTRAADAERVERVIGPQLMEKYGGVSITMRAITNLLKGNELTDAQKKQLNSLIYNKPGEPRVSVKIKNPIDEL